MGPSGGSRWLTGAEGLKASSGGCQREADKEGRKRARGRSQAATSTKPCRESHCADRTVIIGCRQRTPDHKKQQRCSKCRVAALNITATSLLCISGLERGVQCGAKATGFSGAVYEGPSGGQVGQHRLVSIQQGPHSTINNTACISVQMPKTRKKTEWKNILFAPFVCSALCVRHKGCRCLRFFSQVSGNNPSPMILQPSETTD